MRASSTESTTARRGRPAHSLLFQTTRMRAYVLCLLTLAAFGAGLSLHSLFGDMSPRSAQAAGGKSYHLPVNSRQLTVSLVPLRPSAKVEALINRADSGVQQEARALVSEDGLSALKDNLAELYPFQYRVAPPLEIPDELFDFERQQYKTSLLLNWFHKELDPTSFRSAGLLYADVYDDGYNFLFGQARLGGALCIASSARMPNREGISLKTPLERWQHIVRHELGHTLGLEHVPDQRSVMAFGNSLAQLDIQGSSLTKADWRRLRELHPIKWERQAR